MTDVATLALEDAPEELIGPIKEFFPEWEWDNAARIAYLESGWKWNAENDTTGPNVRCGDVVANRDGVEISAEHSIGYFQINACSFAQWNPCHLFNVRQNVGTAHWLWERAGGSWSPWFFSAQRLGLK